MIMVLAQAAWILPVDTSALESSISALEKAISALDSEIKSLEISSVPWEHWVWVFTFLVAIGVAMELWVIRREWDDDMEEWALAYFWAARPPLKPPKRKLVLEIISVLLITTGVMGELGVGIKIASINSAVRTIDVELRSKNAELRSKSDQLLSLVTQEAGGAAQSAKIAHDEADTAHESASSALSATQEAGQQTAILKRENTELATNLSTTRAQLEAVDAKRAQLEKSLINLAVCNAPRVITSWSFNSGDSAIKSYVDPLRPMAGQMVFIEVVPDEEARRAALNIARTLVDAHWNLQMPMKFADGLADGVSVQPSVPWIVGLADGKQLEEMSMFRQASEVSEKLVEFLHSYDWEAALGFPEDAQGKVIHDEKVLPAGAIRIQVGLYPPAIYVSPPGQKELTSRMEELKQEQEKANAEAKRQRQESWAKLPPVVRQELEQAQEEWEAEMKSETSNNGPCQVLNPLF